MRECYKRGGVEGRGETWGTRLTSRQSGSQAALPHEHSCSYVPPAGGGGGVPVKSVARMFAGSQNCDCVCAKENHTPLLFLCFACFTLPFSGTPIGVSFGSGTGWLARHYLCRPLCPHSPGPLLCLNNTAVSSWRWSVGRCLWMRNAAFAPPRCLCLALSVAAGARPLGCPHEERRLRWKGGRCVPTRVPRGPGAGARRLRHGRCARWGDKFEAVGQLCRHRLVWALSAGKGC